MGESLCAMSTRRATRAGRRSPWPRVCVVLVQNGRECSGQYRVACGLVCSGSFVGQQA